jgi:hypothetical protein
VLVVGCLWLGAHAVEAALRSRGVVTGWSGSTSAIARRRDVGGGGSDDAAADRHRAAGLPAAGERRRAGRDRDRRPRQGGVRRSGRAVSQRGQGDLRRRQLLLPDLGVGGRRGELRAARMAVPRRGRQLVRRGPAGRLPQLDDAEKLLAKRVVLLPKPFAALGHALSGGLARDLIRTARALFDLREPTEQAGMAELAPALVRAELKGKRDGTRSSREARATSTRSRGRGRASSSIRSSRGRRSRRSARRGRSTPSRATAPA